MLLMVSVFQTVNYIESLSKKIKYNQIKKRMYYLYA